MAKIKKKVTSSDKVKNHPDVNKIVRIKKNRGGVKDTIKEEEYRAEESTTNRSNPANMLRAGQALVGLSKGVTLNLGSYQSARIDCWVSRVCNDSEKDIMDNLAEISVILDEQIEYESDQLQIEK